MDSPRERAFWKRSTFWITVAAIVLPFGWLLLALKLEPVRVRARYFRRGFCSADADVRTMVHTGTVAYEMVRPLDVYWVWFARTLAGLGREFGGLWIGLFNADPSSDRSYELSVALRRKPPAPEISPDPVAHEPAPAPDDLLGLNHPQEPAVPHQASSRGS